MVKMTTHTNYNTPFSISKHDITKISQENTVHWHNKIKKKVNEREKEERKTTLDLDV